MDQLGMQGHIWAKLKQNKVKQSLRQAKPTGRQCFSKQS